MGSYTAPVSISGQQLVTVTATSVADLTKAASANITLSPTVGISVSPPRIMLTAGQSQQFGATVTGTSNTSVTWSIAPNVGSITAGGLYSSPATISGQQLVTVTATSAADPTKTATATVTLSLPVNILVNPPSVALTAGQSQQFGATVTGTSNTAVNWSITPNVGSITAGGLYTAPASISSQQLVTVTGTSVSDATKTATAVVTLTPTASISIGPASVALTAGQSQQFGATVTGTSNTAVNWSITPNVGSITAGGLYAAPASISSQQLVTVKATSVSDATKTATATVTLTPTVNISVSPPSVALTIGQSQQFGATMTGTSNTAVNWSVTPNVGSITAGGLYTAPGSISSQQFVTVTAASVADPTKIATATVTLTPTIAISVSPPSTTLGAGQSQQFGALVTGTSNTAVNWSITPNVGSITAGGLYTAPAAISGQQIVTVTATSVVDPTKTAIATVTLSPTIGVSVNPPGVALTVGQTQQFGATVTGTSNPAVNWSITPNVGNITAGGLYTAPAIITGQQLVTVTATSVSDATKTASATVTLTSTVSISVSPSTVTLTAGQLSQQFSAIVTGASNPAVNWSIAPSVGSITAGGLYTAPATISGQVLLNVTATSVADPTKAATATVTLSPTIGISVNPLSVTLTVSQSQQFGATVTGIDNTEVNWSITPNVGSITASGLYTAPTEISSQQIVTVTATSIADPTKTSNASLTLTSKVRIVVSPPSMALEAGQSQQFGAIVTGTSNTAVNWSITPNVGSITTGGHYTAPAAISGNPVVTVTATTVADPTKTATAIVTLTPTVSLSVNPSTVTLAAGQLSQQFGATVTGTSNTAVNWSITPNVGSITTGGFIPHPPLSPASNS